MQKQILQVLAVVSDGPSTSYDVHAETGLSVKHCASYLCELEKANLIKRLRILETFEYKPISWPRWNWKQKKWEKRDRVRTSRHILWADINYLEDVE